MAQLPSKLFHVFLEELSLKKLENSMQVLKENGIDTDAMVLVTIEDLKLMFPKLGDFLKIKSVFLAIYSKYGTSMDEILSKIKSDSIKQPIIIALGVTGNIS
ncbi:uncharacterized protein LOC105849406 isoform X2 [Hydra vulgaris]|uniref:uncharacterized protein LOC105849406 isoform X2 n=1 Tax=Hydra vulgaris TaxID=6087 RepID=UPI00019261C4|nr:uncharacterized protein LOC105849406 isoform X3 [Hydra vulgaris]